LAAHALAVVNAVGNVVSTDGRVLAGSEGANDIAPPEPPAPGGPPGGELGSTVLAVVAVETRVTKNEARWLAARGSDGITISVSPAHTRYDGDVVFGVGAGDRRAGGADLDVLGRLATDAVAGAIRDAVS
jgi:L-aminopeptidase/D-esterase-like protein